MKQNKKRITNASVFQMCKKVDNQMENTCKLCPHHSSRKASLGAHRNLHEKISHNDSVEDNYVLTIQEVLKTTPK